MLSRSVRGEGMEADEEETALIHQILSTGSH